MDAIVFQSGQKFLAVAVDVAPRDLTDRAHAVRLARPRRTASGTFAFDPAALDESAEASSPEAA